MHVAPGINPPTLNPPTLLPGLIVVDGPIGVGKTTFVYHLAEELRQKGNRVQVIDECIPENLEEYYKDPKRDVYTFQKVFVQCLFDKWCNLFTHNCPLRDNDFVICDRYWASTRAFVKYHVDKGNISAAEYDELTNIINLYISLCPLFPEYYIFLDASDRDCISRIHERGRPGEIEVGDEYMCEINEYIRRYNSCPFYGEGESTSLFELVDTKASHYIVPRATLGRFAQNVIRTLHVTDIEENTTKGILLPERVPVNFGIDLDTDRPVNMSTRQYLMDEAKIIASTKKRSSEVIKGYK